MNVKKSKLAAVALAAGGVLAFAVPAGAAVNLQSESPGAGVIKIVKNANLKANGAATVVTINVTCPVGSYFGARVDVNQTVGNITTGGRAYTNEFTCTGAVQKVKVAVLASPAPFKAGLAYAQAELTVRNGYSYGYVSTGREIVNVAS